MVYASKIYRVTEGGSMQIPSQLFPIFFCQWCSRVSYAIEVHGHTQCLSCKSIVEPCCQGEMAPIVDDAKAA